MAKTEKFTPDEIIQAIEKSEYGKPSEIADALGCSDRTIYNYIKRYETVKSAIGLRKERQKDYVEGKLFSEIKKGNITAIIFYLKTQAKDRGYVERQEVTGADSSPIELIVKYADKKPSGE